MHFLPRHLFILGLAIALSRLPPANAGAQDSDGDGILDGSDVCPSDSLNDADADAICVGSGFNPPAVGDDDNCPVDPNSGQQDGDGDGRGDVCDQCANASGAAEDACLGTGVWQTNANSNNAHSESGLAQVDGLLYLIAGQETSSVEIYDPATDTWTFGPSMPSGNLHHIQAVVVGSKIYVPGGLFGFPGPSTANVMVLDTQNLGAGWQMVAPMPTTRGALGCAANGAKIYCAGGLSSSAGNTAINAMEVYNTVTDQWQVLTPMPRERDHFQLQIIGGKAYAAGGRDTTIGNTIAFNDIYDIATDTWSAGAPIPTQRGGYGSEVLEGRLIVIGGEGNGSSAGTFPQVEEYDPVRDLWRTLASVPTPRHGFSAAISAAEDGVTRKLYAITGSTSEGGGNSHINQAFFFGQLTDNDGDGFAPPGDCNDNDNTVFPGAPELCDSKDNDCDGQTDEGNPGGGASCDTGLLGACASGTRECSGGSLVCVPNSGSVPEICDGVDNDCDGSVDEGSSGTGGSCLTGQQGVCAAGTFQCIGGTLQCVQNDSPSVESCDGLDNDCDGIADEGNPGAGAECSTGLPGVCVFGTTQCVAGSLECSPDNPATVEVCDGLDNDCDGIADEGNAGGGGSCSSGQLGICDAGTEICQGGSLVCVPNDTPSPESCNGADDDCDGQVDEGNPGGGGSCSTGVPGSCSVGVFECQGGVIQCVTKTGAAEVCDGQDNDCDGEVDEGNPGGGATCSSGQPGVCDVGAEVCRDGALVCEPLLAPSDEICASSFDEDCDGQVDETDCQLCLSENTSELPTQTKKITIKLPNAAGNDKLTAKGAFVLPAPNASSPDSEDVTVRVADQAGTYFEALLPAGTMAKSANGRKFIYKDDSAPFELDGVRRAKFGPKSDLVTMKYTVKAGGLTLPDLVGTTVEITIKIANACYVDPSDECAPSKSGKAIKCR